MPYNGSGSFTLAQPAFVPATVISSSAMNSDLSDIATNGLTNAVTKDGQTTITGAFKGASGSVGLPMYSFSADPDTGMYRIGANNIGISVNATKILDIGVGGLTATYLVQPAGTVFLPTYTFAGDLDSGIYSIGANNVGVAVNAAKVLDISSAGLNVVGSVSSNGAAFSPTAQAAGMVNGTIVESHAGNAVTFAIKTLAGADPSATDIVYCVFRNVTAATGNYVVLQLTAALSLTISSGSTMGFTSAAPGRLWFVLFNDAGTIRLGIINCLSGATSIYPLSGFAIASSTAEGGTGGADSAQIFYTGTAVTSKAYSVIGYASYETALTTAGNWDVSPARLQLYGDGVRLPGVPVQCVSQTTATSASTSSASYVALTTTPSLSLTPTSTVNLVKVSFFGTFDNASNGATMFAQIARGTTQIGSIAKANSGAANVTGPAIMFAFDAPQSVSAQTYQIYGKTGAGTLVIGGATVPVSFIAEEIQV